MSNWKNTSGITSATSVFKNCYELKEVILPQFLSLTTIQGMFMNCGKLQKIDMNSIYLDSSATVAGALNGVPTDCIVYVNSDFMSKFTPENLGWPGGTFIRK